MAQTEGDAPTLLGRSVNFPSCHAHTPATGSAPSPLSAPSVHTPRAYYTAASPALPAVPGCCRTRPPRRCSRWQGWCHPRTELPPGWCPCCSGRKAISSESYPPRLDFWCAVTRTNAVKSLSDEVVFSLSGSKCTVSARFLHGFKTCKGCKLLQNRTKGAETRNSKFAMYRKEITLKRNFQKLRESPGVRYESVGRGFESLPSHQVKSHD